MSRVTIAGITYETTNYADVTSKGVAAQYKARGVVPLAAHESPPYAEEAEDQARPLSTMIDPIDKININTANEEQLAGLDGIGQDGAQRIIVHRFDNPFETVDDLTRVGGIGKSKVEKLREFITV